MVWVVIMSKRFIDTELIRKSWYRRLTPSQKALWIYLVNACDVAGVVELDLEAMSFAVNANITMKDVDSLGNQIEVFDGNKIHILDFVSFQFGQLSAACKPHLQIIKLIEKYDFKRVSKGYPKGIQTLEDKDKDKDKEMDMEKEGGCKGGSAHVITGKPESANVSKEKPDKPKSAHTEAESDTDTEADTEAFPPKVTQGTVEPTPFDTFWKAYPKKMSKGTAKKAFDKAIKITSLDTILEAIGRLSKSVNWIKEKGKYIPYPATWLNAMGWEDEATPVGTKDQLQLDMACLGEECVRRGIERFAKLEEEEVVL